MAGRSRRPQYAVSPLRPALALFVVCVSAGPPERRQRPSQERQPNVVFILADDLGYNEMGFMNSTRGIKTPTLDALARGGVILKNYYVQPICSPTRSALLAGRLPLHLGTQAFVITPPTPWAVDTAETLLPQNLQDVGYRTAIFGKWHLGMFRSSATPRRRGFDEHMGYYSGCQSKATHVSECCVAGDSMGDTDWACKAPRNESHDHRGYDWFRSGSDGGGSEPDWSANHTSSAKLIGDAALEFIARVGPTGQPFFLYLPFQNIHMPYTVEERFHDRYASVQASENERTIWAYISEMDEEVGRVLAAMKAVPGCYENSVIIFSSDNGAPPAGPDVDHHEQLVPGAGAAWSARNFPLRGHKGSIWEGGTRVPGFVHSPLLPDSVQGSESQDLFHVTDWLPTIVRLAGGQTSRNRPLDGHDIWDAIAGRGASPRTEMVYNVNPLCHAGLAYPPKAGIRVGRWKLLSWCYEVEGVAGGNRTGPVEGPGPFRDGPALFDLEADPRETIDVSGDHPERVAQLLERLKQWAQGSVEPFQLSPPYQGPDYFCASCPRREGGGPDRPHVPWISDGEVGEFAELSVFI